MVELNGGEAEQGREMVEERGSAGIAHIKERNIYGLVSVLLSIGDFETDVEWIW